MRDLAQKLESHTKRVRVERSARQATGKLNACPKIRLGVMWQVITSPKMIQLFLVSSLTLLTLLQFGLGQG